MTTLREGYQAASDEDYSDQDSDYNAVYAAGPGFGEQEPMNITAGQGSGGYEPAPDRSFSVNLGPAYHYENGQKVYDEGDYAPGPNYSSVAPRNANVGGATVLGGAANSAANYPVLNKDWATPYNQALKGGATTGIKSGITSTSQKPLATVQTSKTVFPSGAKYPTFTGPTWDEKKIARKAAKAAAPGIAALEMKVQQAMARYYENPNVRRMVLRDTLAGYGIGLSNIRAGAARTAQAEYGQEYARMYSEAMNDFNRALGKLEAQSTKVSAQQPVYTKKSLEELTGDKEHLDTLA